MNVYVHTKCIKIKQDLNKYTETTDVIRTCCTVSAIAAQTVLSMQKCNHLFTSTSSFQLLFAIFSELMNHVCPTDFMFDLFDFIWKFHRLFLHRFKEICSTFTIWYFLVYMVISECSSRYHGLTRVDSSERYNFRCLSNASECFRQQVSI